MSVSTGISLPLFLLTALLTPLAIWGSFAGIQERCREYYALMLLLHGGDAGGVLRPRPAAVLRLFRVHADSVVFPDRHLGRPAAGEGGEHVLHLYLRGQHAVLFAAILYLGWQASLYPLGPDGARVFTLDFDRLYELAAQGRLTFDVQWWLFLAFFAGFAIKVPLFPLHTWLPLAHTEAPTAGSVILAAVPAEVGHVRLPAAEHAAVPGSGGRAGPGSRPAGGGGDHLRSPGGLGAERC